MPNNHASRKQQDSSGINNLKANMDYKEAEHIMTMHEAAVTGRRGALASHRSSHKKLCNKTWLTKQTYGFASESYDDHFEPELGDYRDVQKYCYSIELFGKGIITFFPHTVVLDDHGYFSRTTHDRFNTYLPGNWRVHGETNRCPGGDRYLVGFINTQAGEYTYKLPRTFLYNGKPAAQMESKHLIVHRVNHARKLLFALIDYAKVATTDLCSGKTTCIDGAYNSRDALSKLVRDSQEPPELINDIIKYLQGFGQDVNGYEDVRNALYALIAYGPRVLSKSKARDVLALRAEATLRFGRATPDLTAREVHSALLKILVSDIHAALGFSIQEWNRR